MKTVFLRVIEADDKATVLLKVIRDRDCGHQYFEVDPKSFAGVPRSPFAYWVSERLRLLFKEMSSCEGEGRTAKVGLQTSDDFRFVRMSWEAPPSLTGERWFPFAKGGKFSAFYADIYLCVNWAGGGAELYSCPKAFVRNPTFYFRPALTWPLRTNGLSFRAMPAGCIFGHKGPAVFVEHDRAKDVIALASLTNSRAFGLLVSLQLARTELAQSYEVGLIQNTPFPELSDADHEDLARLGRLAWSLKRSLDTHTEVSHAFTLPALLQVVGIDLLSRAATWSEQTRTVDGQLVAIHTEIDKRCFTLYGINEADGSTISEGVANGDFEEAPLGGTNDSDDETVEDADDSESASDATGLAADLASWAVGVAFGRFDVRLATGERPIPNEPEPFDALPACSPGMLTDDDGLPLERPPAGYPIPFPKAGALVDDPGQVQDLSTAVRRVFDVVFGADSDRWWNDMVALLDPKGHYLPGWLAGNFFEHHLKRHSKSRRKAPILWQLSTSSGSYSVWLYAQRLTRDSFFLLQNDVIGPKLVHEERQLTRRLQGAGGSPSAVERKEIAAHEIAIEELRTMLDEVKRIAPLWNPQLDDGVVLTMAPLWRLVPQCKPWQKELKSKWDELALGKYDWAHIAMHLWPERVLPKCAKDRSLAIAHGIEDVFWVEDANGKWKPRATLLRSIDELVRERSSPAVKAALKNLLDAPTAS